MLAWFLSFLASFLCCNVVELGIQTKNDSVRLTAGLMSTWWNEMNQFLVCLPWAAEFRATFLRSLCAGTKFLLTVSTSASDRPGRTTCNKWVQIVLLGYTLTSASASPLATHTPLHARAAKFLGTRAIVETGRVLPVNGLIQFDGRGLFKIFTLRRMSQA